MPDLKKPRFKTTNSINMILNGEYCWEILKENDNTEVFRITLGEIEEMITLLYTKETLSIRNFNTSFSGGDIFFLKMPFGKTHGIIKSLLEGHNLKLMPIYHISTVKVGT